jgi:predicted nucleotidyltransferase
MKTASVIDFRRKRLAPTIWDGDKMKAQVRAFILGIIKKNFPGAVGSFVIGSITTKRYTNASDVDVNVIIPKSQKLDPYRDIAKALNKERIKYTGSPHVITFFVVHPSVQKDAIQKTTGAYSLTMNSWLKRADNIGADPKEMEGAFQGQISSVDVVLGELKRDISDIKMIMETYKEAPESEKQKIVQAIRQKKQEVKDDLKAISDEYDEFHQARLTAFEKELDKDPNAAKKHLYNQTLPGNVVFKMMERYGYRELLERLKEIHESMP